MSLILDAASRPYGEAVRDSEYDGIVRYLSEGGFNLPGKQLLPDEAQSYIDANQTLVSNWETYASRMNEGYDAGHVDVRNAWYWHKFCGGPDNAVIYFSADWDVSPDEQDNVNAYLQACIDYLGVQSVGVYGGYYTCQRVHKWNPDVYLWQTKAWSGNKVHPDIHLLQRIGTVWVGGAQCDVNEVMKDNYGQWNIHLNEGVIPVGNVTSLVDGKVWSQEEMLAFIDYHSWRSDQILTSMANMDGIANDDEALKTVKPGEYTSDAEEKPTETTAAKKATARKATS